MSKIKEYNGNIMELVISKRLYLVFSGLLILLVCIFLGCGQQSKEQEVAKKNKEEKTTGLELIDKSREQKAEAKIQLKKEINQSEPKLSKRQKKQIEKKVLEVVKRIEMFPLFRLEDFKSMEEIKKSDIPKGDDIRRLLMELVNIGKAGVPTLIKVIKDRRKNWQFRALIIYVIVEMCGIMSSKKRQTIPQQDITKFKKTKN
ncbi:MAG: hypothetical protein AB1422_16195 [bacterium]